MNIGSAPTLSSGWIQTVTGQKLDVLKPDPDTIDIRDIAHGTANTCRYNGQCKIFYSSAEHALIMSYCVPSEFALATLMHDATDAYLPDMPSPYKSTFPNFVQVEKFLQRAIFKKFNIHISQANYKKWVKRVDLRILLDEKEALFDHNLEWHLPWRKLGVKIECLTPYEAERRFLIRFKELTE